MSTALAPTRQWQVSAAAARAYERHLVPLLFAPGAEFLVELAEVGPGERVLDMACGTGIVARTAARLVGETGSVAGIDVNEAMLEVARSTAPSRADIDWRRGDAAALPFEDGGFDVVLCQQGLQFFPDAAAALEQAHRVLGFGGRLALSVLRPLAYNPGWAVLAEVLERDAGTEAGAMMRSPFSDYTTDGLREVIAGVGFTDVRILHGIAPVRYPSVEAFAEGEAASSPMAAELSALPEARRAALLEDLATRMAEFTDDAGIVFPAATFLATARKRSGQ